MKEETMVQTRNHLVRRSIVFCIGLIIMAFGVAFSIKATLGTSPISSLPYVTASISGLTVGTTTIIMNFAFVFLQILILRKQYEWLQLLQLPVSILFGLVIDFGGWVIEEIPLSNYFQQWFMCILGILFVGIGGSIEVMANFITNAGEGVVLAICKKVPMKFGNMKMIFDISLVCISILLSLLFLKKLDGIREGTIAAAILVGYIAKLLGERMQKVERVLF